MAMLTLQKNVAHATEEELCDMVKNHTNQRVTSCILDKDSNVVWLWTSEGIGPLNHLTLVAMVIIQP